VAAPRVDRSTRERSWRLRVYAGRGDDGRKRYVSRTVHGSREAAQLALDELLAEVERSGKEAA
jgi:integrase